MAAVKPFAALRPDPDRASRLCELPYDVLSSEEARRVASGNPWSFLHVSKPEIDLPPDTDPCAPAVYERGRANFEFLRQRRALRQDPEAWFHLYRQGMGEHQQTGLVAVVSCAEYRAGVIRKHELTRPDKEDDRVRHIDALDAQTGPAFLTYPASAAIDRLVAEHAAPGPEVDFMAADGIRHTGWTVRDPAAIRRFEQEFAAVPRLYIADGHHRSAAAARVAEARQGRGESSWFLAVIFPHDQMLILPYHRALKDLNGWSEDALQRRLGQVFDIRPGAPPQPSRAHTVSLYLRGRWYGLTYRRERLAQRDLLGQLDVTLLQEHVLGPVFGIADPRTSQRLAFIGGIHGPAELQRRVDGGEFACAFSMFPTGIEELLAVADTGGILPPKSTWFEPKLRDGMFSHLI